MKRGFGWVNIPSYNFLLWLFTALWCKTWMQQGKLEVRPDCTFSINIFLLFHLMEKNGFCFLKTSISDAGSPKGIPCLIWSLRWHCLGCSFCFPSAFPPSVKMHVLTQFIGTLPYKKGSQQKSDRYCVLTSHTVKITFIAENYAWSVYWAEGKSISLIS